MFHQNTVSGVRLVSPRSEQYRLFLKNILESRPAGKGQRNAGEMIGRLAEQAVRHWLYQQAPLDGDRILAWQERARPGTRYRELDAVRRVDAGTACLFEIKLASPKAMENAIGLGQLDAAADILLKGRLFRRVCRRLVYVSDAPSPVGRGGGIELISPDDMAPELGVVWVPPSVVAETATALALDLPPDWFDPAARRGDAPGTHPAEVAPQDAAPFNTFAAAMERAVVRQAAA